MVNVRHDAIPTPFGRCAAAFVTVPSVSRPDTTGLEEQERERRRQVMEKFQKAPFEEIAAHCESKVLQEQVRCGQRVFKSVTVDVFHLQANMLHDRLAQIFELTIR